MARRTRERATDRLNIALSRITANAALIDLEHTKADGAALTALRKQIEEAAEEGYAVLNDIRHIAGTL